MSNKRKLWQIFGPVLCAFILLIILFLIPWQNGENSDNALFKASVSQSQTVFKGQSIKQAAFEKNYVPFLFLKKLEYENDCKNYIKI